MNKFVKGAIVCASIVPCLTTFVACGDDNKSVITNEEAYNEISGELSTIVEQFSNIENYGSQFQLNVNCALDINSVIGRLNTMGADFSLKKQIRAVVGASNGDVKQFFANLGIVEDDEFISLLSAYACDKLGDEEYTQVLIDENNWEMYKGYIYTREQTGNYISNKSSEMKVGVTYYKKSGDIYVELEQSDIDSFADNYDLYYIKEYKYSLVEDDAQLNNETEYFIKSVDYVHIYLASHTSLLKEYKMLTSQPIDWNVSYYNYYVKVENYTEKGVEAEYEANKYYYFNGDDYVVVADEVEPSDWATGSYYVLNVEWQNVEGVESGVNTIAPTFEKNKYYEQVGIDVAEFLPYLSDGLTYTIMPVDIDAPKLSDEIINEDSSTEEQDIITELKGYLTTLSDMTYENFKGYADKLGITLSSKKYENGDISLILSKSETEVDMETSLMEVTNVSFEIITNKNNKLAVIVNLEDDIIDYKTTRVTIKLDIELVDKIDLSYIPNNLEEYGEAIDFNEFVKLFTDEEILSLD